MFVAELIFLSAKKSEMYCGSEQKKMEEIKIPNYNPPNFVLSDLTYFVSDPTLFFAAG